MSSNNNNAISNGSSSTNRWDTNLQALPHPAASTTTNNNNNISFQTFQHSVDNNNYLPPFKRIRLENDQIASIANGNLFSASPALLEIINKVKTKSITIPEFIQQIMDNFNLVNDGVLNILAQKGMYEEIKSLLNYKVGQNPLILNLEIYKKTLQIFYGLLSNTPQTELPNVRSLIEDILDIRCEETDDSSVSTIAFYQTVFFTESQQFLTHLADAQEFQLIEKVLSKRDQLNETAIIDWKRLSLVLPLFSKMVEMGQFEIVSALLHAKGGDLEELDFVDNIFNETSTENCVLLQDLFCRFAENGKYYLIKDLLFRDIDEERIMVEFEIDKIIKLFKALSDLNQLQDVKELLFNWYQTSGIYSPLASDDHLEITIEDIERTVPVLTMLIENNRIQVVYDTLLYAGFERVLKYRAELSVDDRLESMEDFITLYTNAKQGHIIVNFRLENLDRESEEELPDMQRWNNALSQNNPQLVRDILIEKDAFGEPLVHNSSDTLTYNFYQHTAYPELLKMIDNGNCNLVFDVFAATDFFGHSLLHKIDSGFNNNEMLQKLASANLQKTLDLFRQRNHNGTIPAINSYKELINLVDKQLLDVLDLMRLLLIQNYTGESMLHKLIEYNLDYTYEITESKYIEIYKQITPAMPINLQRLHKSQLINLLKLLVEEPE